ncbi:mucin TcMUCII [Planoprotostelium fungivorum]|uniref:Mucin TcMUCII n=1 Tax=Planoprotostelium fungivorum TaxID=1890364 RepID=A0A2P6N0K4_9EUKA|nr:mucin TcMUCII [Planoprotostelium fungivorum]
MRRDGPLLDSTTNLRLPPRHWCIGFIWSPVVSVWVVSFCSLRIQDRHQAVQATHIHQDTERTPPPHTHTHINTVDIATKATDTTTKAIDTATKATNTTTKAADTTPTETPHSRPTHMPLLAMPLCGKATII